MNSVSSLAFSPSASPSVPSPFAPADLPLPLAMFDALAGGVLDAETVHHVLRAERGRRLLLLQHVLVSCRNDPALLGPLGDVEAAYALLLAVGEHDPSAQEHLLLDPHTGMWLAHAVQIVERVARSSARPHWVHLGGLATLAACAALRAGMTFSLPAPAEHGHVLLPGLGRLELPGEQVDPDEAPRVVTVSCDGHRVLVSHAHARVELPLPIPALHPGWNPTPLVRTQGRNGHVLQTRLDHLDPAPHQVGLPRPAELSAPELAHWERRLVQAWALIDADHPQEAAALAAGLGVLMPLPDRGPLAGSSGEGVGAAALRLPATAADLACALIHEFTHSMLNAMMHQVHLYRPQAQAQAYYAPWRDDPRPLSGMLHGAYAFSAVTAFWQARSHRDTGNQARRAQLEFAVWRLTTAEVLDVLASDSGLTREGLRMVSLLQQRAAAWRDEEVQPQAARLARIVTGTHRATWRVHHVRPAPAWLAQAAEAWRDGRAAPMDAREAVVTDPSAHALKQTFVLARWAYAGSRGPVTSDLPEARARDRTGADRLLVGGDGAAAAERYLAQIGADPDDPLPWGGLGPALAAVDTPGPTGPGVSAGDAALPPATGVLLAHPERVRALYRRLRAEQAPVPDVLELARWLAGAP